MQVNISHMDPIWVTYFTKQRFSSITLSARSPVFSTNSAVPESTRSLRGEVRFTGGVTLGELFQQKCPSGNESYTPWNKQLALEKKWLGDDPFFLRRPIETRQIMLLTPLKTNIAPENDGWKVKIPSKMVPFEGTCSIFLSFVGRL